MRTDILLLGRAYVNWHNMSRCACCRFKFETSQLTLFKLKYYCKICLPGVKLAHSVIDAMKENSDVQNNNG